ncbi:uncharacterized protein LOC662417 isoform X2 [Tribolium castaneum]|uniref:uncharacterized protein LOC662417 isoform X2 n=1 Tax=Tribolium castaneum TaxID=7070 RepID=UPI00046BEF95|nr:PREDICTED: uncharacterized protein LOC662417 isoform X2 [Tribolium castaneum]|eukprot:XP_008195657.1 PREDICTED: uncharacterized protein LOC662417 isoform X2 [Tribolium castaneum]
MATLWYMFVCFCWWSLVNSDVLQENLSNKSESHSSEISAVLNHLNSSPFKVYNYNKATLLNAQTKADIIELILDIDVDCINKYPNVPCGEKVVTCHAFVRNTPEEGSKVLTDVNCKPKPEIIVDEPVYDSPTNPTEVNTNEPTPIVLSNEAVSSEVGEHFVAVRKDSVPCLGCPFDLNTNAEGVDELIDVALEHIQTERAKKHALVKVLRLQQQVVTGVKYILTAEFAPTLCEKSANLDASSCPRDTNAETTICEITYLHKPWISKAKHVIKNNCTVSQEYVRPDIRKSDIKNGAIDEMTPSRLADLESQIIVDVEPEIGAPSTAESHPQVESKLEFDLFQTPESLTVSEDPAFTAGVTVEEPAPTEEHVSRLKRDESSEETKKDSSSESVETAANQTKATKTSSSEENSSEEVLRPKRAIRQLEKISPDEKGLVKNLADFAANALDSIDDDNNKRIILQILGAKKMVGDDGVYYHIIMRMGVSRCLEDSPINPYENCKDKLFENYTKICKVQVYVNDDFGSKKVVKSQCQNIKRDKNDNNRTNYSRYKRDGLGAPNRIDKNSEKIRQFVKEGINGFNANYNSKNNKVKPVEVVSATTQVVAGTLYKITTKISESDCSKNDNKDLDDCNILEGASPKTCELEVWEKLWENFRQFTIKCEGDEQSIKFQTSPKNRAKRQAPGGESPVTKDNEYVVKYLEAALNQLDSESPHENKFKVHEFISATSQTVSGHIYRIKTKVVLSDCKKTASTERGQCGTLKDAKPKTCKFEVFEQTWVPNSRRIKTDCDKERRKRKTLDGGITEVDKDDDEVKTFVREGLLNLNTHLTTSNKVKPVEVVSASVQVVAGSLHRIKVKISESDCSRNDQKDFEQCNVLEGASPKLCEMEVWDKPWEDFRRYTIKCEGENKKHQFTLNPNKRTKRQVPRGESPVAKDNEYVIKYLEAALNQLDAESEHENKFKVHEFISATSQIVSGHIYRINAKVILSDCKKTVSTERGQCGTLKDAKPKTCKFEVFEQLWVPNSRQIKTDCHKERRKRQTLPGGIKEVDKNNDEVKTFVHEGLLNLNTHLTTSNKVKPVEVVSASVQVVAGSLHRIKVKISESDCSRNDQKDFEQCNVLEGASPKLCEMEVWDKPWEDFRRYTIKCEGENKKHQFTLNPNKRTKRQVRGGESPVAKDNEYVIKYLEAALNQLDAESEHENKFKVHEFISATSQIVSGHIYRIKAKVILSDCKKSISTERGQCGTLKDAKPKTCKFEVFEQLWVPNSRQIKTECDGKRVKRQRSEKPHSVRSKRQSIPGGATEIDKKSDKVKQYVRESLTHLNTQLTSSNKVKPVEVLSATSQVVAGTIHRIKVKISESDCSKDDEKDFDECNIREGASPKICEVKVWDKPWQNFRQYNITCEGEDHHYTFETKPGKTKRSAELDNLLGCDDREYHLSLFTDFLKKYNKKYHKKEYKYRFNVFVQNLMQIRVLNTFEQGTATYGITRFADMTQKEFSRSLGLRTDLRNENETPFAQAKIPNIELPKEFDWRKKNVVTEVKNQEQCGSCWAFSVTGNVEGQYALRHGKLLEFSEQELVDCDTDDQGCNGGLMDTAYRSIEKIGGLETEQDYPYDAEDEKCHFNRTLARVQVTGALNISHNETDMAKWLVANGPISIAINANAMQFYMGGVSHPFKFLCSPKNLDHGVLIVGYGVHNYPLFKKSLPYWIVKNSWGTGWGEQGYYRVYRGDGTCGLNQTPSSAIVA